jgi:hypothetical protein
VSTSSSSSTDSARDVSPVYQIHTRVPTVQEGNQLLPCPFRAQRKGDCVQAVDGIQAQNDIVVLQFVDKDGDWVELVVLVCFHGGRSVSGND